MYASYACVKAWPTSRHLLTDIKQDVFVRDFAMSNHGVNPCVMAKTKYDRHL